MENVLKRGRTIWDRSLLPEDEYVERVRAVRAVADAAGLDVVVTIGHSTHTGNFTYLSGSVPPIGWMAIVLGREAGPFLVSGGGSRDLPFLRTQTWIDEIRTSRSLFAGPAEAVTGVLAEIVEPGARVGLVGARDDLAPDAYGELLASLAPYDVVEVDGLLAGLRAAKRPREQVALERSLDIARAAADAAVDAWESGASTSAALIEAERTVRMRGARDARVLGNLDATHLAPVEEHSEDRGEHLAVYVAAEYLGYWAQACASTGASNAARRVVDAMIDAAEPGGPAGSLVTAATRELPAGESDVALAYGLGYGTGLDLMEPPLLRPGSHDRLLEGAIVALQVVTVEDGALTCAGATIRIDAGGVALL
jgi:Xaa-Pro aminopeptidase